MFKTIDGNIERIVKYKVLVSDGYERIRIEYTIYLN